MNPTVCELLYKITSHCCGNIATLLRYLLNWPLYMYVNAFTCYHLAQCVFYGRRSLKLYTMKMQWARRSGGRRWNKGKQPRISGDCSIHFLKAIDAIRANHEHLQRLPASIITRIVSVLRDDDCHHHCSSVESIQQDSRLMRRENADRPSNCLEFNCPLNCPISSPNISQTDSSNSSLWALNILSNYIIDIPLALNRIPFTRRSSLMEMSARCLVCLAFMKGFPSSGMAWVRLQLKFGGQLPG